MKIRLFVNTYKDPEPERDAELLECLRINQANPLIDDLIEVKSTLTGGRPTFSDVFDRAADSAPDDIIVVTNSDIYFDQSLELARKIKPDECYALSRWNKLADGALVPFLFPGSQDVWIFRGPPRKMVADFFFGIPQCDNRVAAIIQDAGYVVTNPCKSIRVTHLHNSGIRRYDESMAVQGERLMVPPCYLDRVAIVQLARYGDIVSVMPIARELHRRGMTVDWFVHPDFMAMLEAVKYANIIPWQGEHHDVPQAIAYARKQGYTEVLATQVHGNKTPIIPLKENFVLEQWTRGGMLPLFHELPLVFDQRDYGAEQLAVARWMPPPDGRPLLTYCMSGVSSQYGHTDEMNRWIEKTFAASHRLLNLNLVWLDKIHHMLAVMEKTDLLLTVDTLAVHAAYGAMTPTIVILPDNSFKAAEPHRHWIASLTHKESATKAGKAIIEKIIRSGDRTLGRLCLDPLRAKGGRGGLMRVPDSFDGATIATESQFSSTLRQLILAVKPKRVLETGTLFALGTTTIIGRAIKETGVKADFVTIEANPEHAVTAAKNIAAAGLPAVLERGLSVPRSMLPGPRQIAQTMEEIGRMGESVYVDHHTAERVDNYWRETDFAGPDDLLGKIIRDQWGGDSDIVLLDSGGHLGFVEFTYVLELLQYPCWVMLDDTHHVKHFRSLRHIKADKRFVVAAESNEKFGFALAYFDPRASGTMPDIKFKSEPPALMPDVRPKTSRGYLTPPQILPVTARFIRQVNVSFRSPAGLEIWYTVDGTHPGPGRGRLYTGGSVPIVRNTVVKAVSRDGPLVSAVSTLKYLQEASSLLPRRGSKV